jgi:hypothetical protein
MRRGEAAVASVASGLAVSVALAAAWGNSFRLSPPGGGVGSGPKNIQHTVRYTEMAPDRFKEFLRN